MTPQQFSQLRTLAEKLCDIAIEEADPDLWPGSGKKPAELTKQERGDRFWSKKNAAATLNLATNISQLVGVERLVAVATDATPNPSAEEIERMIAEAERAVRRRNKGTRFDNDDKAN